MNKYRFNEHENQSICHAHAVTARRVRTLGAIAGASSDGTSSQTG
jgi:hypothetical protein